MDGKRRHRIIFLGAGFSKPAGLPLGPDLWQEIQERASLLYGRASKFHDDVRTYQAFLRECDGVDLPIDQILTDRTPRSADIPELYLEFARCLQPGDLVLTFNYDVLLERALERVGKAYRLFPHRYTSIRRYYGEVDSSRDEVILLKVHGSIDWFDRRRYLERVEGRAQFGLPAPADDPIFARADIVTAPLVDWPRFPEDPLQEMHRVRNVEQVYRDPPLFHATPWLLTPSSMKVVYALKDFWRGLGSAGALNVGMAIIGFSLPSHDEYARQVLYRAVCNYQRSHWDQDIIGHRKTPLVLIDYRPNGAPRDEFQRRYAFVDWRRAACCFDGFTEETLVHLFADA